MTVYNGFPPFYSTNTTTVLTDPNQLYLLFSAAAVFFGLILVLPGIRGRERCVFLLRWSLGLIIGSGIIACLQGTSWHVGSVDTTMFFDMTNEQPKQFRLHLMVGLQHFNISLRDSENSINLNEKFSIIGVDKDLKVGLRRGLPFPILKVAEYFSLDQFNSQWHWGRQYWQAGHYAFYLLWTSLITWILTVILLQLVIFYGGLFLLMTGVFMLLGNLSFFSATFVDLLNVRLGTEDPPAFLTPQFGWCFWLCFVLGIVAVLMGCAIVVLDYYYPFAAKKLFNFKVEKIKRDRIPSKDMYFTESFANPSFKLDEVPQSDTSDKKNVTVLTDGQNNILSSPVFNTPADISIDVCVLENLQEIEETEEEILSSSTPPGSPSLQSPV